MLSAVTSISRSDLVLGFVSLIVAFALGMVAGGAWL